MSMETDSPVVYHGTSESRFPPKEMERMATGFTLEERKVIRECSRESLYYRCIPFMVTGIAAVQVAARKGYITPNPVWGTGFSSAGAALVGWVVGKFSYGSKCEEKFLQLQNSPIADAIRKKRGYIVESQSDFPKPKMFDDVTKDDPAFSYYPDTDFHSSSGSLNLDVDKNVQYSGLDDQGRPSTDRDSAQIPEEPEASRRYTTYDELRRINREEFERSQKPLSSRLDIGPPSGQRPYSNVDTVPPRRYYSDPNDGSRPTNDGENWDNAKLL